MTNLRFLWNPFSRKTQDVRERAKEERDLAMEIHKDAIEKKALHQAIYEEHKELADKLRRSNARITLVICSKQQFP